MSILIKQLSYIHPNREILFQNINLSISSGEKGSLIGNNGSGKSTLLQVLAGKMDISSGEILLSEKPYFVPQHLGQYDNCSIAQVLGIEEKIRAFHRILEGNSSIEDFTLLDDDWNIEERVFSALNTWNLSHLDIFQSMQNLSGGEKTKIFLSGIAIHSPSIILFDEPSNHLDRKSRVQLYDFIQNNTSTMLVVSHDRTLLNLLPHTYELTKNGIQSYGGNYEFYKLKKEENLEALQNQISEKEKELRKSKKTAIDAMERQQKQNSRGEKLNLKKGIPRIAMDTFKDQAERSTSKLKGIHADKISDISENLSNLRNQLSRTNGLKLNFEKTNLHQGKILVDAKEINFGYGNSFLWTHPLSFQIRSGDRKVISGQNGCGKSTLIKIITGQINPQIGAFNRTNFKFIYVDQDYSIIDNHLSIYEQIQVFNSRKLLEHEIKMLLNRFLFPKETWDKRNENLSGGEKMRLLLCCLQTSNNMPDIFILDEPTNNLDIQSLEILTQTIKDYQGTILLISHDEYFVAEMNINSFIAL